MKASPDRVRQLIEAAVGIFGSEAKLGGATGYSQNAIWAARRRGSVSAGMAKKIHTATNGVIPQHQLRPDVFDAPETQAAS